MNKKSRWVIELDYFADDEYDHETLAEHVKQEVSEFKGPFQRLEYDNIVCLICDDIDDAMSIRFQIPDSVVTIERVDAFEGDAA